MGRNTFQSMVRSTGGRPLSVIGLDGLPTNVLRYTMGGVLQLVSGDIANKTTVVGMLPAFLYLTGHISILNPGGTLAITLPAYKGLAAVTLRAAAAVVVGTRVAITTGATYAIERPIAFTGDASAVGTAVMGIECFPLDDATIASN